MPHGCLSGLLLRQLKDVALPIRQMGSCREVRLTNDEVRMKSSLRCAQMVSTNDKRPSSFIMRAERAEFCTLSIVLLTLYFPTDSHLSSPSFTERYTRAFFAKSILPHCLHSNNAATHRRGSSVVDSLCVCRFTYGGDVRRALPVPAGSA